MIIRIAKADAAFVYALLEGYEGLVNYSTLPSAPDSGFRELAIFPTESMQAELKPLYERIAREVTIECIDESPTAGAELGVAENP